MAETNTSDATLSVTQAAKLLKAGRNSVLRWTRTGVAINGRRIMLAADHVGTHTRISPAAVEQFRADCHAARTAGGGFSPEPHPGEERERARRLRDEYLASN